MWRQTIKKIWPEAPVMPPHKEEIAEAAKKSEVQLPQSEPEEGTQDGGNPAVGTRSPSSGRPNRQNQPSTKTEKKND